jgi:hypothetical protein
MVLLYLLLENVNLLMVLLYLLLENVNLLMVLLYLLLENVNLLLFFCSIFAQTTIPKCCLGIYLFFISNDNSSIVSC